MILPPRTYLLLKLQVNKMTEDTSVPSNPFYTRLLPIVRVLFLLNTILWLSYGVFKFVRMKPLSLELGNTPLAIPTLMIGNAAAFLLASIGISKKRNIFYYFAISVILLNIILIALDPFGIHDLFALLFDMLLLALLPMLPPWRDQIPLLLDQ